MWQLSFLCLIAPLVVSFFSSRPFQFLFQPKNVHYSGSTPSTKRVLGERIPNTAESISETLAAGVSNAVQKTKETFEDASETVSLLVTGDPSVLEGAGGGITDRLDRKSGPRSSGGAVKPKAKGEETWKDKAVSVDSNRHLLVVQYLALLIWLYVMSRLSLASLSWRQHDKPQWEHLNDLVTMCLFALVIEQFSRVSRFIQRLGLPVFGLMLTWHLVLYSLTYEKAPGAEWSNKESLEWTGIVLKYFASSFAIMFFVKHIQISRERDKERFRFYAATMVTVVCAHFGAFYFLGDVVSVHIHHYYWSMVLACMARYDHETSFAAQLILNAIMVHGFAAFGPDPVFKAPREMQ